MIISTFLKNLIFAALIIVNIYQAANSATNLVLGTVEYGTLLPMGIKTKVRLDTGATISSLHAENMSVLKKGKEKWVRFDLQIGKHIQQLEYKIIRYAKIKNRNAEIKLQKAYDRRPVILMELCLASQKHKIEVNLTDRANFTYPMLLGRQAMKEFGILIDPNTTFSKKPMCSQLTADNK